MMILRRHPRLLSPHLCPTTISGSLIVLLVLSLTRLSPMLGEASAQDPDCSDGECQIDTSSDCFDDLLGDGLCACPLFGGCSFQALMDEGDDLGIALDVTVNDGTGLPFTVNPSGTVTISFPLNLDATTQCASPPCLHVNCSGLAPGNACMEAFASPIVINGLTSGAGPAYGLIVSGNDVTVQNGGSGTNADRSACEGHGDAGVWVFGADFTADNFHSSCNAGPGFDILGDRPTLNQIKAEANLSNGVYIDLVADPNLTWSTVADNAGNGVDMIDCSSWDVNNSSIHGNSGHGLRIEGGNGTSMDNNIGTNDAGDDLGNDGSGIVALAAAAVEIANNKIMYNMENGILMDVDDPALNVEVALSAIAHNLFLGIDVWETGDADGTLTPNTAQGERNFPTVAAAEQSNSTLVSGTFNAAPSTTYTLEFFANDACDASGYGEGQIVLGSEDVTTDASGDATFNADLPVTAAFGSFVTATATGPTKGTSEFSQCVAVAGVIPGFTEWTLLLTALMMAAYLTWRVV